MEITTYPRHILIPALKYCQMYGYGLNIGALSTPHWSSVPSFRIQDSIVIRGPNKGSVKDWNLHVFGKDWNLWIRRDGSTPTHYDKCSQICKHDLIVVVVVVFWCPWAAAAAAAFVSYLDQEYP